MWRRESTHCTRTIELEVESLIAFYRPEIVIVP